jgi:hypothetical protein
MSLVDVQIEMIEEDFPTNPRAGSFASETSCPVNNAIKRVLKLNSRCSVKQAHLKKVYNQTLKIPSITTTIDIPEAAVDLQRRGWAWELHAIAPERHGPIPRPDPINFTISVEEAFLPEE